MVNSEATYGEDRCCLELPPIPPGFLRCSHSTVELHEPLAASIKHFSQRKEYDHYGFKSARLDPIPMVYHVREQAIARSNATRIQHKNLVSKTILEADWHISQYFKSRASRSVMEFNCSQDSAG